MERFYTLQHTVTDCNTTSSCEAWIHSNTLQLTAPHCNTLQHTATPHHGLRMQKSDSRHSRKWMSHATNTISESWHTRVWVSHGTHANTWVTAHTRISESWDACTWVCDGTHMNQWVMAHIINACHHVYKWVPRGSTRFVFFKKN